MWKLAVVLSLLAVAARAEFPFTDTPLQPSINSNKVFFNITDIKEVAGVWKGINTVYQAFVDDPHFYDGVSKFNMTCDRALTSGWNYDYFILGPRSIVIEVDQNRLADGLLGNFIEADNGQTRRFGISEYNIASGLATLDNGSCRMWRPYFDWEVGKTMLLRNYRYFFYPNEDGATRYNELEGCVNAEVDHPQCIEGTFDVDGGTHTGVALDNPFWMECIAGPCLDLPFTLDGYVQTQGYIPSWVSSDGK